jgi:hypothetical protein
MTYQIESEPSPKRRSAVQSIWDVGVILSLVILAITAQSGNFGQQTSTSSPLRPMNAAQVAGNPSDFTGKTITVRSKAIRQIGSSSFMLKDGFFSQQEPVLVINASGVRFNLPSDRNTEIQITGQVREFSIADINRDYNLNLQEQQYSGYVNKPVIVAQYIALAPQPSQVAQAPERYYGKTVAITGQVDNIQSPILMTIHKDRLIGSGRDLPVLMTSSPKVAINEGQTVAIVGEVRPFIADEIEQKYQLDWDANVKKQLEAEYGNTPVLVAEAVYP